LASQLLLVVVRLVLHEIVTPYVVVSVILVVVRGYLIFNG
jgi:hypothetical protein